MYKQLQINSILVYFPSYC